VSFIAPSIRCADTAALVQLGVCCKVHKRLSIRVRFEAEQAVRALATDSVSVSFLSGDEV
jgi:hypothetical protein